MAGKKPVAKVKRSILEACMKCPLCNKLLRQATTISLCLHTFCRKCIYDLLSDDEVDTCPVCDIDLGILPVEKLRPDHNLQDIRAKVFPLKSKKVEASKVVTSIAPPAKRKERSLSSLVVSTPKVPEEASLTRRKTKVGAARTPGLRSCDFTTEESNKDEDSAEDHPISSSSPDSENKISQRETQVILVQESTVAEPSSEERTTENGEIVEGKADQWTPLNFLVEVANSTKSSNSPMQTGAKPELSNGPVFGPNSLDKMVKLESHAGHGSEMYIPKSKSKEHDHRIRVHDEVKDEFKDTNPDPPPVKRRRLTAARRRAAMSEELSASTQVILDAAMRNGNRRDLPVWNEDASLPQIPTPYLRIKDGKMPVSFIQKYLVKKLDLSNEAEVSNAFSKRLHIRLVNWTKSDQCRCWLQVEIMCRGQPVVPTLQLQNLVDLWFQNAQSKKVAATVGSSAKDFVMVLSYCRKVEAS
ncbi:E3 ubiquitin protein ligase DRIP2 [Linum perenne]